MILLFVSFFSSLLLILGIIRYKHLHEHFSGDHDLSGPQKFHQGSIPRIGGLGIYANYVEGESMLAKIFGNHPSGNLS